jgi:hypothetical protein
MKSGQRYWMFVQTKFMLGMSLAMYLLLLKQLNCEFTQSHIDLGSSVITILKGLITTTCIRSRQPWNRKKAKMATKIKGKDVYIKDVWHVDVLAVAGQQVKLVFHGEGDTRLSVYLDSYFLLFMAEKIWKVINHWQDTLDAIKRKMRGG